MEDSGMDFRPRILVSNTLVSTKIKPEYPTYSCNHIWYLNILYTVDTWISYTQLPPHTIPGWFTSVIKTIFNKMAFLSFIAIDGYHLEQSITYFITLVWEFAAQSRHKTYLLYPWSSCANSNKKPTSYHQHGAQELQCLQENLPQYKIYKELCTPKREPH